MMKLSKKPLTPRCQKRSLLSAALIIGGAMTCPQLASADTMRSSASYGVQFDVISSGSGPSSSASYSQPQSVIGQSPVWNSYSSNSYEFQPVGTFLIQQASNVIDWLFY